ncbi:MAG TPA: hypothetical protein VNO14_02905 [Blastocatellia bacterium]|nr:hypothetical protein [Blastocatellia bacterium]
MEILTEETRTTSFNLASLDVKIKMLHQMAEALEDEAAGLYRRAAIFEEEEFLLNREIEERQTEINRLQLKLEALGAERDRVIGKIHEIQKEVAAMREEISNNEEEAALASIGSTQLVDVDVAAPEQPRNPLFFQRMTLT